MKKLSVLLLASFLCIRLFANSSESKTESSIISEEELIIDDLENTSEIEALDLEEDFNELNRTKDNEFEDNESENNNEDVKGTEKHEPEHISLPFVTDEDLARPEVERFRQQYLTEKWSALLHSYLENAMEYRLYVRQAVSEKEMPPYLEYLPVVESNYKTNAKSKSGAIGMWQFMANSVWPFLTLNDYVDERLDPWKSTDAALRKLTDNYNYFKDWYIAIAAYNCGVGAMNRCLKKSEKKDFWYMVEHNLLPKQTALYVPKLLAIADLAVNYEYYGIDLPDHKAEFEILENEKNGHFDYLTVNKAYSLNSLAQSLRIDSSIIKHLNPSFLLGFTHPSKESKIRLPLGMQEAAEEAIKTIEPISFPIKYKVAAGDSLWSISRRYNVKISAICELNGIEENAILRIGKILYIPAK